ncbi:Fe-S cluster assembly protein NifU [Geomonas nitrogeniifigens]|uniref:Nitrogen fixation protein NifU n=1 Tax=Geomonas diazotrophica TaxID=2843197 RepID=A0ABX8JFU9_9BACT|nr:Fe-S cluster assembly protein NifU [Geomonas nitrogeniifigens]QWV96016.1 Fe-S cluster assembly protein NifU [Geomonas nitrogeniifigens]QXE85083.1 Fe-S cluster assembly protein NifU [Geomonas nitrogeniifigens]
MWDYTDKVKEHFLNPRNVGEITDADAVGEVGSLACGDALKLFIKLDENKERIVDAKFQTFGCGSAIASSSALTEMVKGKTLDEALEITNQQIADFLGGLPEEKMHCSVMGQEALEAAIAQYRGVDAPAHGHGHEHVETEGELVCKCFGLTDVFLKKVIASNKLHTAEQVTHFTKAGGACGGCIPKIKELIAEVMGEEKKAAVEKPAKLTNLRKMQLIQETLENEIRPQLWADGGDLELIDIDGSNVQVAFRKACAGCASSGYTAKFVEQKLRELVSPDITVQEVQG